MIPYGAEIGPVESSEVLGRLGLERRKYFLYVSRMEPENNALLVREAFETIDTEMKLALIGDAPYAAEYIDRVRDTRDPRVVIPGAIYGAWISRARVALFRLYSCDRSGRHTSRADRGDGARRVDAVS